MICLNCGRPNPSGTSLCSRCRERRPGLERARGGVIYQRTRETARVRNRGSGVLVVGVLLLAGLIFAGGTLAVFLSGSGPTPTNPGIAFNPNASPTRLEIFEQFTPTPVPPTGTPWFPSFTPGTSPTDFGSFFPSPSGFVTIPPPTSPGAVTPKPTRPPTPTPAPTPTATPQPVASFTWNQLAGTLTVKFKNTSNAPGATWLWDFGNGQSSTSKSPSHPYNAQGPYTVTLTVTNGGGSNTYSEEITVDPLPPPTEPPPTEPPTAEPPTAAPPSA